jgi:hypothetical protein
VSPFPSPPPMLGHPLSRYSDDGGRKKRQRRGLLLLFLVCLIKAAGVAIMPCCNVPEKTNGYALKPLKCGELDPLRHLPCF